LKRGLHEPGTALKGAKDLVTAIFEMQDKIVAPIADALEAQINALEAQRVCSPTRSISIFKAWAGS
jgi:hypothetical protein